MSILSNISEAARVLLGIAEPKRVVSELPTQLETVMSDTNQATTASTAAVADTNDALVANIKKVLTAAGHDVEAVWDEVVALAKKL